MMAIRTAAKKERQLVARRKIAERGHVYFLRASNTVKIGFSTNLRSRLKSIRTGCPDEAKIVKIVRGGMKVEKSFHDRFAEYRTKGEWFELRGRLAKYLEMCLAPVDLPERADEILDKGEGYF